MAFQQAQAHIDRIALAIAAGDLEAADGALKELKPLLVSDRIEELRALKARIDEMTLVVRKQRSETSDELRAVVSQRQAVQTYQSMDKLH